jgi:hypothetical protein
LPAPSPGEHDIIEPTLEQRETRAALLRVFARHLGEVSPQLRLRHAVVKTNFLLFFELAAIIAFAQPRSRAVNASRIRSRRSATFLVNPGKGMPSRRIVFKRAGMVGLLDYV